MKFKIKSGSLTIHSRVEQKILFPVTNSLTENDSKVNKYVIKEWKTLECWLLERIHCIKLQNRIPKFP